MNKLWRQRSKRAIVRLGEFDWYFGLHLLQMGEIADGTYAAHFNSPGPSDALRRGLPHHGRPNRGLPHRDRAPVQQPESAERSSDSR